LCIDLVVVSQALYRAFGPRRQIIVGAARGSYWNRSQLDQDALHRQSCIYPVDADPMNSIPFGQIIEIPDVALNEKLILANDNREPTARSKENFEAGSILVPRAYAKPGKSRLSLEL
jgi:hypothetical protein